jgi:integrase
MRLGEVTSLTRASFQKVHLKAGDEPVPVCIIEKTKNREPLVLPMSGWPLDYVEARVENAQLPTTPLFPGPGGRGARMAVLRHLPTAVRAAGLRWGKYVRDEEGRPLRDENGNKVLDPEGITFHATRHSMASLAKEAGLSTEQIMLLGNWKTAKVVEGYAHTTTKMTVDAAARMANVIRPKRWEKRREAKPEADRSSG